ncbi:MAG: DNA polymerase III subunit beta [Alphaproteobacteria bacterium]
MKFTIEKSVLLKALEHVQSVVEKQNTIPILSNVRFEVNEGKMRLNATDMELEISESVPVQTITPGATTVPAHTLYSVVRRLPDGVEISIETQGDNRLTLAAGRFKTDLGTLPVDDFPLMSASDAKARRFKIDALQLCRLIGRTKFAMSTEETRYFLNGIYFHETKEKDTPVLRAVATDGHRLARVDVPLPDGAKEMAGVIIPRKTVNELSKLLDGVEDVEVAISESRISFNFDNIHLVSRLIDGTFPDYTRVIPEAATQVLETNVKAFSDVVGRVSAISNDRSRAIKISISDNIVRLSVVSAETGTADEELEVKWDGSDLDIGFNVKYLLEIMQQLEGDAMEIALQDNNSQAIIREPADESSLFVIMPMRV